MNLEILNNTTLMHHDYIKVMFDEKSPRVLTSYNETQKTLDNATTAYMLGTGFLEGNTSKTFTLKLWMDEDIPPTSDSMNKLFKSKVTITTVYEEKMPGTLRIVERYDTNGMWEYKNNITKLVIQDSLEEIPNSIKTTDESELNNGSIISYVVENEKVNESDETTYTAYLQGNKIIHLNLDSSYLFENFSKMKSIEGMEYLDTSNVVNMIYMFSDCSSLTSLNLSSFDTTNIGCMGAMFLRCYSLVSLDLSSFNT